MRRPKWLDEVLERVQSAEYRQAQQERQQQAAQAAVQQQQQYQQALAHAHAPAAIRQLPEDYTSVAQMVLKRKLPTMPMQDAALAAWDWERSMLLTGPTEVGKSIAITMILIRAARRGMSIAYHQVERLRPLVDSAPHWARLEQVDVLALDQLHKLATEPEWMQNRIGGIINERDARGRLILSAATAPVWWLTKHLQWETVRRYPIRVREDGPDNWKPGDPTPEDE